MKQEKAIDSSWLQSHMKLRMIDSSEIIDPT